MPKATLEFSLPEENTEFTHANKGGEYFCALWEIDQHCRSCIKHGHIYKSVEDLAEAIRDMMPNLDK